MTEVEVLQIGNGEPFALRDSTMPIFNSIRKVADYLFEINYSKTFPKEAKAWMDEHYGPAGGCSSCRVGNLYGRNYDWLYDEAAEFVVRVSATEGRHGSIGVASAGTHLTNELVSKGGYDLLYKVLPHLTLDGINDAGLVANLNVVPKDDERDAGWTGTVCNSTAAIREVLDRFTDAETAAEWIAANVYLPDAWRDMGFAFHFMIGDATGATFVVEDGVAHSVTGMGVDVPVMTNFRLYKTSGLRSTCTFEDVAENDPNGSGVERYALLKDGLATATTANAMAELMRSARFTNAYDPETDPPYPWPTEFVGVEWDGETLNLQTEDFADKARAWAADKLPVPRSRGDGTWQTVHCSIYDIAERKLVVYAQEGATPYEMPIVAPYQSGGGGGGGDGDVKHSDFADIETKSGMTLKEVGAMVNVLIGKLKGTAVALFAAFALVSLASAGTLTPTTDFGDIGPTEKLKDVVNGSVTTDGITEPKNQHWTWTAASDNCPQDFLDRMAEYGAPKPIHHPETGTLGTWANVVLFYPDGKPLYVCYLKDKAADSTEITFMFDWMDHDGVTTNASFFATATRPSASDTTPVQVSGNDAVAKRSDTIQKAGLWELYRVEKNLANHIDEKVGWTTDVDGNKTAISLGSRYPGSTVVPVGQGTLTVGEAAASGQFAVAIGSISTALGDYSLTIGSDVKTEAAAISSVAAGSHAVAKHGNSFVWQGDDTDVDYESHDDGTFNINPEGGLSGFWIGNSNLEAIFSSRISASDQDFKDAVLAVGLNIDADTLQWLKDIGAIAQSTTGQVGLGTLVAALLAALMYLKRNKADKENLFAKYAQANAYSVGNLVLKDGTVYKCKTAVAAGSAWDATKWETSGIDADAFVADCLGKPVAIQKIKEVAAPKQDADGNFYFEVETEDE